MGELEFALADKAQKEKLVWQAREWVMFCAKTIEAQGPGFWKDLLASIEKKIKEHQLSPVVSFHLVPSSRFILHKSAYPAVTVEVEINLAGHEINYIVAKTPARRNQTIKIEKRLMLYLDDAGELYLKQGDTTLNVDDAAKLLLLPFTA